MNNRVLLGEFLEVVIILNQQKAAGGFRLVAAKKNCLIHDVRKWENVIRGRVYGPPQRKEPGSVLGVDWSLIHCSQSLAESEHIQVLECRRWRLFSLWNIM